MFLLRAVRCKVTVRHVLWNGQNCAGQQDDKTRVGLQCRKTYIQHACVGPNPADPLFKLKVNMSVLQNKRAQKGLSRGSAPPLNPPKVWNSNFSLSPFVVPNQTTQFAEIGELARQPWIIQKLSVMCSNRHRYMGKVLVSEIDICVCFNIKPNKLQRSVCSPVWHLSISFQVI